MNHTTLPNQTIDGTKKLRGWQISRNYCKNCSIFEVTVSKLHKGETLKCIDANTHSWSTVGFWWTRSLDTNRLRLPRLLLKYLAVPQDDFLITAVITELRKFWAIFGNKKASLLDDILNWATTESLDRWNCTRSKESLPLSKENKRLYFRRELPDYSPDNMEKMLCLFTEEARVLREWHYQCNKSHTLLRSR